MLKKIISGAQTGADQGGLEAGRLNGLMTGGTMPKGFRTDEGPRPDLAKRYGVVEHSSRAYPPRTEQNVADSDGTLIFGRFTSAGCALTYRLCIALHKPYIRIYWDKDSGVIQPVAYSFQELLTDHNIETLNVAGNREDKNPGIYQATINFITNELQQIFYKELP